MVRKLRMAWSVGCGIVCVLLIALWVRSYYRTDYIRQPLCMPYMLKVYSQRGLFIPEVENSPNRQSFKGHWFVSQPSPDPDAWRTIDAEIRAWKRLPTGALILPYWFLSLAAAIFAAVPWVNRNCSRF